MSAIAYRTGRSACVRVAWRRRQAAIDRPSGTIAPPRKSLAPALAPPARGLWRHTAGASGERRNVEAPQRLGTQGKLTQLGAAGRRAQGAP